MSTEDLKTAIAILAFAVSLEGFIFTLLVYRRGIATTFESLRATVLEKNMEVLGSRDYLVSRTGFLLKRYERAYHREQNLASEPTLATLEGDVAAIQAIPDSKELNPALSTDQVQYIAQLKYSPKNHLFLIEALSDLQQHSARLRATSWTAHLDGYDQVIDEYLANAKAAKV